MKHTLPLFQGTIFNEKYSAGAKTDYAVLLLHGYPSTDNKNEYIAEFITENLNHDAYIFHYEGLGKSHGLISFPKSITDAIAYYEWLVRIQAYKNITIIGHSWGGLIALNIITNVDTSAVDKLILMSPYNYFPTGTELKKLVDTLFLETKTEFKQSKEEMINQVKTVISDFQPRSQLDLIKSFTKPVHILQAVRDLEVPPITTEEFVSTIKQENFSIDKIDTDHSFTENRKVFLDKFISVMRSK